jgi:glycogen debranching enzyme
MNDQVTPVGLPGATQGAQLAALGTEASRPGPVGGGQPYLHNMVSAVCAPAMALSGSDGQVRPGGAQGLYVNDVRVLSALVLSVDGQEPVCLRRDLVGGAANEFQALAGGPEEGQPDPRVLIARHRELHPRGMIERISFRSYAPEHLSFRAELSLSSDFAGIAAVKQGLPALAVPARATARGLAWEIPGRCSAEATGSPSPPSVDASHGLLAWDVELSPGAVATISLSVEFYEQASSTPVEAAPAGRAELAAPTVVAGDHRLARWVELSVADLARLRMAASGQPGEVFVAAGAPWYLTLFGRDSLWAARLLLPLGTDLALGTLGALARRQGRSDNQRTAEQAGKILHELRRSTSYDLGDDGERDASYFSLPPVYYGTVDATPLWVCLLHDAWRWGAPEERVEALLGPMVGCLEWLEEEGSDERGFLSYVDVSGHGLTNQGWKDSADAIQYRDGRLAEAPVALCEAQGYAYEAAVGGAELLEAFGRPGAERWRVFAERLAEQFRARFWVDDGLGPYPAIALDGRGSPVDALSSNIGHLLGTGILNAEEAELVARRLGGPDLSSGFGLRTLAKSSRGFNPLSYHCGSVWAHDTAIAVAGLARSGTPSALAAAASLVEGLLAAAESFAYRVPELYGGNDRCVSAGPLPYPASCHPQAWTAAASVAVLSSLLRLQPDVPHRRVSLAPVAAETCLRSVDGLSIAGHQVKIEVVDDKAHLSGLPPGIEVTYR